MNAVDRMNARIVAACGPRKPITAEQIANRAKEKADRERTRHVDPAAYMAVYRARLGLRGVHFIDWE